MQVEFASSWHSKLKSIEMEEILQRIRKKKRTTNNATSFAVRGIGPVPGQSFVYQLRHSLPLKFKGHEQLSSVNAVSANNIFYIAEKNNNLGLG